ncbi:hypothetical protein HMPREF1407_00669 [Helicobacter pylori GAM244Ai]|nr:hypothetical protein HMPREF1407_00669 [Helicobacter pylori GAM244Ai]
MPCSLKKKGSVLIKYRHSKPYLTFFNFLKTFYSKTFLRI